MKVFPNKSIKMKYTVGSLLHNRFVLYFLFIIALLQLIYFLNINDMFSFSSLILVGLLTSFFNKNMTIILLVAIVFTHVIKYGRKSYTEGMDDMKESKPEKSTDPTDKIVADLSKIKDISKKIDEIKDKANSKDDIFNNLEDIKDTRDKIVQNIDNVKPLLEKFQGYIEKYKNHQEKETHSK